MIAIICCISIVLIVLFIGYLLDIKMWNNGHCPKCDDEWKQFDVDSQGGIGFKCKCGNSIWLNGYINTERRKKKTKELSKFQLMSLSK